MKQKYLIILAFVLSLTTLDAEPSTAEECSRQRLSKTMKSLYWPVLSDASDQMYALDAVDRKLVRIGLRPGEDAGKVSHLSMDTVDGQRQFVAFSRNGKKMVQVYGDADDLQIQWLDQDLQPTEHLRFGEMALRRPESRRLLAPYYWIAAHGHILGYGAVSTGKEGDYELGFFDQPLPLPDSDTIPSATLIMPHGDLSFYLVGLPLMVASGDDVFFLQMGTFPSLYRYSLGQGLPPELVTGIRGENKILTDFRAHETPFSERDLLMSRIERHVGPWGLYSQDGSVFLLTRNLTGKDGSTPEWILEQLDIDQDLTSQARQAWKLETNAQQVTLVPSDTPGDWYVFEQSRDENGARVIEKMLFCSGWN